MAVIKTAVYEWPIKDYWQFFNDNSSNIFFAYAHLGNTGSGPITYRQIVRIRDRKPLVSNHILSAWVEEKNIRGFTVIGRFGYGPDGNTPRITLYAESSEQEIDEVNRVAQLYSNAREIANLDSDIEVIVERKHTMEELYR